MVTLSPVFNVNLLVVSLLLAALLTEGKEEFLFPTNQNVSLEAIKNCRDRVDDPEEKIALSNIAARNFTIGLLLNVDNEGEDRFVGGAFFLALDELHKVAKEKGLPVHFNWEFRDTMNRKNVAARQMLDLYLHRNISVFIGPSVFCKSLTTMVTALMKPFITYNCRDGEGLLHDLMVNVETRVHFASRSIISLMLFHKWRSFWLVAGEHEIWNGIVEELKAQLDNANITINDEDVDDINSVYLPTITEQYYDKLLNKSIVKTRVYLFLGSSDCLLTFMRLLHAKVGEENVKKYAVIAVSDEGKDYSNDNNFYSRNVEMIESLDELSIEARDQQIASRIRAFRNLLIITQELRVTDKKDFMEKVKDKCCFPPFNFDPEIKNKTGWKMYKPPRGSYYLYDATMIYGRAVMDLMETPGADPGDAVDVINRLRCRFHESIIGDRIWIHANGQSEKNYVVKSLKLDSDGQSGNLINVGIFNKTDDDIPVYQQISTVEWAGTSAPESDPACGFEDEYCKPEELISDNGGIIAVSVAVPTSVLLIVVFSLFFGIRHCVYEKKLDKLAWKIERDEIQMINEGQFRQMTTPSRNRKKNSWNGNHYSYLMMKTDSQSDISHKDYGSEYIPIGFYRGAYVAIKLLTRKHLELTRVLKKQMQLRKELTHENINRFIGACFEPPKVYIVTQYCPRRSLQDILRNEDAHLDNMFITSLVQDLIRGMTFIHESQFCYHGNLKSSNCLVDSRWTLKISDFGFSALGPPSLINFDDEESFRALLWTAPELLRKRRSSSTASQQHQQHHHLRSHSSSGSMSAGFNYLKSHHFYNNNNFSRNHHQITDSQKGDVYSFAIILYELYGRAGPWGPVKMTPKEIIETLICPGTSCTRPDTKDLTCDQNVVNLIQDCWQQDHNHRPDFKSGIRAHFKPIQQAYMKSNIFDNMLAMMEKYANNLEAIVAERTELLRQEKRMTENLLLRMLPRSVAEKLKRGHRVEPEQYEQVSIYFSDIVGFTQLSASSTPMEVVDLLNDLYTCFDSIIEEFDVYKVETIGDAYMVVSGLPIRNGDRHAGEIASMALELLEAIKQKKFRVQGSTNHVLKIRIGIHSGPCCAGVVGLKMPRYCLFGDTVNTANRMESTGEAQRIHCSLDCKKILDKLGGYTLLERGYTELKGKGTLLTYFLNSEDLKYRQKRITQYKKMGNDGRCVSTSNLDYTGRIAGGKLSKFKFPSNNRDSTGTDRGSWISSLNTSIDSACSDVTDQRQSFGRLSQLQYFEPSIPPALPNEFVSSTLPRACGFRYNAYMTPIAEDPSGPCESSPMEKTVSFPNSTFLDSYQSSETDPLLTSSKPWTNSMPTDMFQTPIASNLKDRPRSLGSGSGERNTCVVWEELPGISVQEPQESLQEESDTILNSDPEVITQGSSNGTTSTDRSAGVNNAQQVELINADVDSSPYRP
ncbi:guanylate cyclase 32E-like [Biomphalaria glabrata]|uniref:Guanylate cyclase n=1 Tax=Biomphalaria glabrata TaxID=6526 RepID=A0A9W2ZRW9_BIOGL|nr:guanylate cyclase 32E-like [Biomphalaria glabrata]XP_055877752.1 guanylate cyclase 32E-like [Biomphalaria glabrata]